ncbi:hypothetical protein CVT24_011561 [Panaeolus cyanescens]|uniref:Uncharacterized protein n=1 Tax=Panaeolus cyanescens TaxID=181874 RepID=A0A409VLV0_9AGAR|nr:hypothetical protein CVT24_011561 [Panaeolus cyanescens]
MSHLHDEHHDDAQHEALVNNYPSNSLEEFTKELCTQDCVIVFIGDPGAGKTTFIHQLTGKPMKVRPPELLLEADTIEVEYHRIEPASWTRGNCLFAIDTPAMDGDQDVTLTNKIMPWVLSATEKRVASICFVYVVDLMLPIVTHRFERMRRFFVPCVADEVAYTVILASTKWSRLPMREAEIYQKVLETKVWKKHIEEGATVLKLTEIGQLEKDAITSVLPPLRPSLPSLSLHERLRLRFIKLKLKRAFKL